ncbi:phosphate uptake regulator PhoU [Candidatus Woesearchaeota archaeon]|nr:phosphate uptake regulator PhoU [Candidatus Woesearchaeota archaeon]
MIRKIVALGHNAHVVTLPAKWMKKNNLKKGDELEIVENKNNLLIFSQKKEVIKSIEFSIDSTNLFMERLIFVRYTRGYDIIKIRYNDSGILTKIEKILEELIGFEIIEQGENYCIIKNVAKEIEVEFENILRRLFLIILEQSEKSLEYLKASQIDKLNNLVNLERISNKYVYFCERIINKQQFNSNLPNTEVYTITWTLEQISDIFTNICNYFIQAKESLISEDIINLYESVNHLLTNYYELFYNKEPKKLSVFRNQANSIEKNNKNIQPKQKADMFVFYNLNNILNLIEHISHYLI